VVLARDAADGGIEILLLRRSPQLRFMGGMYVFPGGAVHAQDSDPRWSRRIVRDAATWGDESNLAASREHALAAIRETCEEAGILVGIGVAYHPNESSEAQLRTETALRARVRSELLSGASFVEVLDALGRSIDLGVLTPLTRWITPENVPTRFDTRFYVAVAPRDQIAEADEVEMTEVVWRSPAQAIEEHRIGTLKLSPPTLYTLEDFEQISSTAALLEYAGSRPPPCIETIAVKIGGKNVILFPGDPEHPVQTRALRGPTRRPI
jgi:8-oxo-dGTP pyrophosphatase MutT (NUDIX family)